MQKKVIILILCLALAVLSWVAVDKAMKVFNEWDSPLGWAKEDYPLGEQKVYILQKNPHVVSEDEPPLSEGAFYFIARPDDKEFQYASSGRQIGKTDVDLEPFIGQRVHIWGRHYNGAVLLLKDTQLPSVLTGSQKAVIHVERVELAQ
jgi:hypothetical protein